jgi:hypothetical protein
MIAQCFGILSGPSLRDPSEENPVETEAKQAGLSYIQLDGDIGCLVNGAGLAMATMDIIKHVGGEPANFLDVGGSASQQAVTKAFAIILHSPEVKGIFVNIFGGIMKCDVIAQGVIAASKEVGLSVPVVVRLEGTNVEEGRKLLRDSGLGAYPSRHDGRRRPRRSSPWLKVGLKRWQSSSTAIPRLSSKGLPGTPVAFMHSKCWPMAPRWWLASRQASRARSSKAKSLFSIPWLQRSERRERMRRACLCRLLMRRMLFWKQSMQVCH